MVVVCAFFKLNQRNEEQNVLKRQHTFPIACLSSSSCLSIYCIPPQSQATLTQWAAAVQIDLADLCKHPFWHNTHPYFYYENPLWMENKGCGFRNIFQEKTKHWWTLTQGTIMMTTKSQMLAFQCKVPTLQWSAIQPITRSPRVTWRKCGPGMIRSQWALISPWKASSVEFLSGNDMEVYGNTCRNKVMAGQSDVMEQDMDCCVLLDDILWLKWGIHAVLYIVPNVVDTFSFFHRQQFI